MNCRRSLLLLALLVLAACGTRLSGDERVSARRGSESPADLSAEVLEDGETTGSALEADGVDPAEGAPQGVGQEGTATVGQGSSQVEAGGGDNPGQGEGGPVAAGEPLVIGTVGLFSGPVGAAWKPMADMLQVWARDVNERGGLDGHPVQLVVVDDGGDPARHMSAVRDLVENRGAFAFSGNAISNSYSDAVRQYLEDRGIPVIGGEIQQQAWDTSPMFFPQGTSFAHQFRTHVLAARSLRPQATRWGQLACRESQTCRDAAAAWAPLAAEYGFEVAYRGDVSIAQPDFTAECLSARNADVEVLAVGVDPNAMRRVAQSCARQGYHPTFLLPSAVVASSQNGDGNFDGAIGVIPTSPWMATGNAANAAMHEAVQRYAPDLTLNMASTLGWAAGMMLEEAVANAGGLGSPPSRERLIAGLHQFTDETLGGVSPPLTFRPGQQPAHRCYFVVEFIESEWTPANNGGHLCP